MPTSAKETLGQLLGDPFLWPKITGVPADNIELHDFFCCPQCGAACLNPYQHKAWHLQTER